MMGDDAFKAYQNYVREHNLVFCDKTTFVGGASGYKVMVGNRTVTVINEKLVPSKEAWCVDTSAFIFAHLDFDFCDYGSSGIFLSCIGEGNGNPLQCSCLENPRDGGALWAAVYGVTQSDTTEVT